jgi:TetR/AcrR family transcriptional regulator, cholesterol catabolism regulator
MASTAPRDARAEILARAGELFMLSGYRGLSMQHIADAVGLTKAALYYYFKDKESLFLAVLGSRLHPIEALVRQVEVEAAGSRERIRLLVYRILRLPVAERAIIRLASQEIGQLGPEARREFRATYHEQFIGRVRAILVTGMAAGELRPVDPGLATWTLLGMMYPYLYPAQPGEAEFSDEAVEQMVGIYLDGVSAAGRPS